MKPPNIWRIFSSLFSVCNQVSTPCQLPLTPHEGCPRWTHIQAEGSPWGGCRGHERWWYWWKSLPNQPCWGVKREFSGYLRGNTGEWCRHGFQWNWALQGRKTWCRGRNGWIQHAKIPVMNAIRWSRYWLSRLTDAAPLPGSFRMTEAGIVKEKEEV